MGSRKQVREAEFTDFATASMSQLYRKAWLLCGDRQKAEDLVQETLIKVYAKWDGRIDNPVAYAHTTLTRTWISHLRRRSNHEQPIERVPDRGAASGNHALRLTLAAALADLDPLDRAVVVLRHWEDASTAEVATTLGLTPGAVRKRLMRALERLRGLLDSPFAELANEGVLP